MSGPTGEQVVRVKVDEDEDGEARLPGEAADQRRHLQRYKTKKRVPQWNILQIPAFSVKRALSTTGFESQPNPSSIRHLRW